MMLSPNLALAFRCFGIAFCVATVVALAIALLAIRRSGPRD